MTDRDPSRPLNRPTKLLLVSCVAVAIAMVALSGGAAANHDGDGDFTVELPDPEDHEPGNRNASANFLILNTEQFDVLTDIEATYADGVPSRCYNADTRVFGIDRGSTYSGTGTDESAIPYAKDTERTRHTVLMEFYNESDTEPSINLDDGDEFVVSVETCVWHPEEPGWYQLQGTITGLTPDDEKESVSFASHYFYICDCESEREAREKLGPPPSETTATPTPMSTPARTATATVTSTPTSTPNATPTPEEPTPTPDGEVTGDQSTRTGTSTATGTQTATPAGSASTDSTAGSPTQGDGPGFGTVAALVAMVGTAIVGLRRRR